MELNSNTYYNINIGDREETIKGLFIAKTFDDVANGTYLFALEDDLKTKQGAKFDELDIDDFDRDTIIVFYLKHNKHLNLTQRFVWLSDEGIKTISPFNYLDEIINELENEIIIEGIKQNLDHII